MANTIVLVHSPLVGAMTWQRTAMVLTDRGHQIVVPTLAGIAEKGPPYYERFADAIAAEVYESKPDTAAFVVHSGAGGLVPSIVAASKVSVSSVIFVDALMPHPGLSWLDTAPAILREWLKAHAASGLVPSWNKWFAPSILEMLLPDEPMRERFIEDLPQLPLQYFDTPAPNLEGSRRLRNGYLQLSSGYEQEASTAERLGWLTTRKISNHLAMLTQPEDVADAIHQMLQEMAEAVH